MRVLDMALYSEIMAPISLRLTQVSVEEHLNRTGLYEIQGWAPVNEILPQLLYRGATVILRAGVVPWVTLRTLCIEAPDCETQNGRTNWTLKAKCAGGRMQRTSEDRAWNMMAPIAIVAMIASQYRLVPFIQTSSPLAYVPATRLQRVDDWTFLQEMAALMECDMDVVGVQLRMIQRSQRLNGGLARVYDLDMNPVTFKREGDPRGAVGAAATNKRRVAVMSIEQLAAVTEAMLLDPVNDPAVGGSVTEFPVLDSTGVTTAVQATGDTVTTPSYLGKQGQFDAGAPEPSFEMTAGAGAAKARHERRLRRDAVSKGTLTYTEWNPYGTPVPGVKIRLTGGELVSQGEYFVVGRKLTLVAHTEVELILSRTGLRAPSPSKPEMTAEALAAITQAGLDAGVLPTTSGPQVNQDFGGGE